MKAFLLALSLAGVCSAEFRVDTIGRLKRDIFRDYDKTALPQFTDSKPVDVSAGMRMYHMKLTDQGELDLLPGSHSPGWTSGWCGTRRCTPALMLSDSPSQIFGIQTLRFTTVWYMDQVTSQKL